MAKHGHWQLLWETWDLRLVILFSFFLQTFLIFSAPLRKRMSTAYIMMPMWLAYLLADLTANFAVGIIVKSQGTCKSFDLSGKASPPSSNFESQGTCNGPFGYPTLPAFWAPILLLHLGGPDTITAFALEDNGLWLRHFLSLGFLCWAVGYAFFQSFIKLDSFVVNELWLPTVLMFFAGLIKYTERTRALYLASSHRFKESLLTKPNPGPNYVKLVDEYISKREAGLPTKIEMIPEPSRANKMVTSKGKEKELQDLEVLLVAHRYFSSFKGLILDRIFAFRERSQSRDFFLKRTSRDAFKVIQVELSFYYELLYTKATVVQVKLGYILRILSVSLNCAALVLFWYKEKKELFKKVDIGITYTLLIGALALDLVAAVVVLKSDQTAVALSKVEDPNWFIRVLKRFLRVDRDRWPIPYANTRSKPKEYSLSKIIERLRLRRRWSESLSQHNLVRYCLDQRLEWWEKTIDFCGLTSILDRMRYVETKDFEDGLLDLIFEELTMKSEIADDLETAREIFNARGDWILRYESCNELLRWIDIVDFDESLIMWHIATELLYNTDCDGREPSYKNSVDAMNSRDTKKNFCELSKLLSDYMFYLLVIQGTMLSSIAGIVDIRLMDTCAEAKEFFRERKIGRKGGYCGLSIFSFCKCFSGYETEKGPQQSGTTCYFKKCCCKGEGEELPDLLQKLACESILAVNTAVEPVVVKGESSKSVLFDACMLAKELQKLERERRWEIVSKVWVELLSYGASHCKAYTHAAQLSNGGQLLTLVWLLIAHLGLGNQFQIS